MNMIAIACTKFSVIVYSLRNVYNVITYTVCVLFVV